MMGSLSARALDRLSSGGAVLSSVRFSLLLAYTAACTAPGLLPVAGFPQVSLELTLALSSPIWGLL